jgi:hypothetical protein
MNFFKKLLGQQEARPDWDIKTPAQQPARRKTTADEGPPPVVRQQKEKNPFLDDDALNSMQLEADTVPEDNPYKHANQDDDPENDTRRMKTIQINDSSAVPKGGTYNPYDTGSMRRGWKK